MRTQALRCFCVPLASAMAMVGLTKQAAKLHVLVPSEKGPVAVGEYLAAADPLPTLPFAA